MDPNNPLPFETLIENWLIAAAKADLQILIRWPGDTPYDGGDEEAEAAAYEEQAVIFRACAHDLAVAMKKY